MFFLFRVLFLFVFLSCSLLRFAVACVCLGAFEVLGLFGSFGLFVVVFGTFGFFGVVWVCLFFSGLELFGFVCFFSGLELFGFVCFFRVWSNLGLFVFLFGFRIVWVCLLFSGLGLFGRV